MAFWGGRPSIRAAAAIGAVYLTGPYRAILGQPRRNRRYVPTYDAKAPWHVPMGWRCTPHSEKSSGWGFVTVLFSVGKTVFVNAVKEGEGKYRRCRITRCGVRGPR